MLVSKNAEATAVNTNAVINRTIKPVFQSPPLKSSIIAISAGEMPAATHALELINDAVDPELK